mmetsp:Transcript_26867/g.66923  ORF Transcript_26867/g.66923 Transcript_26867/m.66923 type:complete len:94 (+) Transcript_26867:1117-1398(+)
MAVHTVGCRVCVCVLTGWSVSGPPKQGGAEVPAQIGRHTQCHVPDALDGWMMCVREMRRVTQWAIALPGRDAQTHGDESTETIRRKQQCPPLR